VGGGCDCASGCLEAVLGLKTVILAPFGLKSVILQREEAVPAGLTGVRRAARARDVPLDFPTQGAVAGCCPVPGPSRSAPGTSGGSPASWGFPGDLLERRVRGFT